MKIKNVLTDLHVHGFAGWITGPGQQVLNLLGEKGERNIKSFSDKCREKNKNTLVGMVNFQDTRYEGLVNTRKTLPKEYGLYDDHKQTFVGVNKKDSWSYFMRGQEIPTERGHVLIIGGDKNIKSEKYSEVIKEAKDMGALKIADHLLAEFGILGKTFNLLANNQNNRYSFGEENLRTYGGDLDAVEACNSNVYNLTDKTELLADKLEIPKIYTSDSHVLSTIFSSYMLFPELDFSNPENLRNDLRKKISSKNYLPHAGKNRRFENPLHAFSVMYNLFRQKTGIISESEINID